MWKEYNMKKSNLTDEELLSYIIGDCDESLSIKIESALKENLALRKRMELLTFIKGEVNKTPQTYKLKEKRSFNLNQLTRQLVLSSVIFAIGIYTQANFKILTKETIDNQKQNITISAPLSWDDSRLSSIM